MNAALQAQAKALADKRGELKSWLDANKGADGTYNVTAEEFGKRNDELNASAKSYETQLAIDKAAEGNDAEIKSFNTPAPDSRLNLADSNVVKTIGEMFVQSDAFKGFRPGDGATMTAALKNVDLKTLMTTAAGYAPANNRTDNFVLSAIRRPVIADLIPSHNDGTRSVIRYMEETTFTNNAAPVAEGAVKPESALGATERQALMQKIATVLPVTDEQLKYVPQIVAYIDGRLTLMLKLSEENQLLNGNGTSPQIQGFLTKSGVQAYTKGAAPNAGENNADAIYRSFSQVRNVAFAEPTGVVLNPTSWTPIRLMKTTYGEYIYGNPSEAGPERIWGKPVVVTTAMPAAQSLTGDFASYSELWRGQDITIDVGYVNDQFIRNQRTIRAEEYLTLLIYRASAFSLVSGLDQG